MSPNRPSWMRLIRRCFASPFCTLLVCGLLLFVFATDQFRIKTVVGNEQESRSVRKLAELRAQLTVGLLPASPSQEAFLDKVVAYVARGTLSLAMVQGTFVWACDQADWAYPYFEQALRERARRAGVRI